MAVTERSGRFEVYTYDPGLGRKVYVGRCETEIEARRMDREKADLFRASGRERRKAGERPASSMAAGVAAEHLAIAELLLRGHAVAKPVVDEDGVDLVVDYRYRVQVKSSTHAVIGSKYVAKTPRTGSQTTYLTCHTSRGRRGHGAGVKRYEVDFILIFDARPGYRNFYVVPGSAVTPAGTTALTPKYEEYSEAWHLFDALADEVEAAA